MSDGLPRSGVPRVVISGLGVEDRGDDAVGLRVVRGLRAQADRDVHLLETGDPLELLDAWQGAQLAIVCDAVRSGRAAGHVHRIDAGTRTLPREMRLASTHVLGLGQAVELARALGRLPGQLWIYGIEGDRFGAGTAMSAEVAASVPRVTASILEHVARWRRRGEGACTSSP